MSTDRDATRIVRSWLRADEYDSADRVLDTVLDQLDTTPQRRTTWWPVRRFPEMNTMMKLSLATAAVVVAALLGYNYLVAPNIGGPRLGDPLPTPSPTPEPVPLPIGQTADQGAYYIADGRYTPVRVTMTIPAGWLAADSGAINKNADEPDEVAISAYVVTHVYADACASAGTLTEIGPTADDLVTGLLSQRNIEATGPTDVDLGGYAAQRVDLAIPDDLDITTCRHGVLVQIWANPAETDFLALGNGSAVSVYVADVGSERVVITTARGADASAADLAELDAIVASMRFEQ